MDQQVANQLSRTIESIDFFFTKDIFLNDENRIVLFFCPKIRHFCFVEFLSKNIADYFIFSNLVL